MNYSKYIDIKYGNTGVSGAFCAYGSFGIVDGSSHDLEKCRATENGYTADFDDFCVDTIFETDENDVCIRKDYFKAKKDLKLNKFASRFLLEGGEYEVYTQYSGWQHESMGGWQRLITSVEISNLGIRTTEGATPMAVIRNKGNNRMFVIHPLMLFSMICEDEEQAKESRRVNMEFFRMLIPYAEKYNVRIAIENLFPAGSVASSGEALLEYINTLNSPYIVACLDTGHANLCGYDLGEMVRTLGEKLAVLHIHDNYGRTYDEHYIPFVGKIDWKSFFVALKEVGYKGVFNLEDTNFTTRFPEELQTQAEQLAFDTLQWLIKEYWEE